MGQPLPPPARSASGAVTAAIAAGMASLAAAQVGVGWRGGAVGWLATEPLPGSLLVGWRSSATLAGAAIALALGLVVAHPSHARTADAVRLTSLVLAGFRHAARRAGLSLAEMARSVDHAVRLEVGEEDFVTAVFLHVDQQGWLEVVNCGHPPPLRLGHDGQLRLLEPASFATPPSLSPRLHIDCYMLRPGDRVPVYTDRLLEARDTRGRSFLLREHLDVLSRPSLDDAVEGLLRRVVAHSGKRLCDDLAPPLMQAGADAQGGADTVMQQGVGAGER
jgi:hypothetical protein